MKFLSLLAVLMIFPFSVSAEFLEKEKILLSILQQDKRMISESIALWGVPHMEKRSLRKELLKVLQQDEFIYLEQMLAKHNLKIDVESSETPLGQHDQEDYRPSSLVLRKKLNKIPLTQAEYELHSAVKANKIDEVRSILESKVVNVNKYSPDDAITPLTFTAGYGYNEMLKLLLEHGADIEKQDKNDFRMTPLIHAVNSNKLSTIKLLVEAGADLNARSNNRNKNSPLSQAISLDNLEVVKYLLKKGANPENYDERGSSPLIQAMWKNNLDKPNQEAIISLLIEKSDVNHKTLPFLIMGSGGKEAPQTALIVALINGQSDAIIDKLYTHGAKIGTSINEQLAFLEAHEHKRKYQYIAGENDAYVKGLHKLIASFKHSKNKDIQRRLVTALGDEYEMSIILGKELNKEDKTLFEKLAKESPVTNARYKMLTIIQQSSSKQQTKAIKAWSKQYEPSIINWCFKYLKEYADTLPSDGKQRVLDAIKVFEKKKC